MKKEKDLEYYEEIKDWDFDKFQIESECLTMWNLYDLLGKLSNKESKILDLGTGGGEKLLSSFPESKEILGTDYSKSMIETANKNLAKSGRGGITCRVMDNLAMDVPDNNFDIVVARNTVIDPMQIYKCLKDGGSLLVHGVDQHDCHSLKLLFKRGQAFNDTKPISIIDYENVLKAGFRDVELVPLHVNEYFKNKDLFVEFLTKVPILDDFREEGDDSKDYYYGTIDEETINKYISNNTHQGKIKLLRRYYGIFARK